MLCCTTPRPEYRTLAAAALAFALLVACGDDKKSNNGINPQTLLTQLSQSLQTCGVLGPGKLGNQVGGLPEGDPSQLQCVAGCVTAADCAALSDAFCSEGGTLAACVGACLQPKCGDGTPLTQSQICDGESDCADGSDEQGCATKVFACADGTYNIPIAARCDGNNDCEDNSDEVGCPTFDCGDESTVLLALRCDGSQDCENGADEAGCPGFTCPSDPAIVIPPDWVCDGGHDCPEGEEEEGCAQFICGASE